MNKEKSKNDSIIKLVLPKIYRNWSAMLNAHV